MDEENQYSSGADVELNVLPTTTIEVEWLNNPSRSRSERKYFFRYLTKTDYELEAFRFILTITQSMKMMKMILVILVSSFH